MSLSGISVSRDGVMSGYGLGVGSVVGVDGIVMVTPKRISYNHTTDMRSNFALMRKGQELIRLVFKGRKSIEGSKITFDENGVFSFTINDVVFLKTRSLGELTSYMSNILEV